MRPRPILWWDIRGRKPNDPVERFTVPLSSKPLIEFARFRASFYCVQNNFFVERCRVGIERTHADPQARIQAPLRWPMVCRRLRRVRRRPMHWSHHVDPRHAGRSPLVRSYAATREQAMADFKARWRAGVDSRRARLS
jgi:hypothetical protein